MNPSLPRVIAVLGCSPVLWGVYVLETLVLSPLETMLARAFGALILGTFLVVMGYVQTPSRERTDDPPSSGSCE